MRLVDGRPMEQAGAAVTETHVSVLVAIGDRVYS